MSVLKTCKNSFLVKIHRKVQKNKYNEIDIWIALNNNIFMVHNFITFLFNVCREASYEIYSNSDVLDILWRCV